MSTKRRYPRFTDLNDNENLKQALSYVALNNHVALKIQYTILNATDKKMAYTIMNEAFIRQTNLHNMVWMDGIVPIDITYKFHHAVNEAASRGDLETIKWFINVKKVNVLSHNNSLLIRAIIMDRVNVVQWLLQFYYKLEVAGVMEMLVMRNSYNMILCIKDKFIYDREQVLPLCLNAYARTLI
jgi:hypothetical protein